MGSRRGQLALAALLVAAAVTASAASGSGLRVLMSRTPNKTHTNRTTKTISGIVIHDTEGRFVGSIRALQNPHVDGSAHFVVSRRGQIVQLVPVTDVAWHSGNNWWNLHSIGIEHEGWAGRRAYTKAEYRASAELVAYLAHRWGVPLDRQHVIAHAEVPDPYHRGRFGGVSHHTDPGPYWNWGYYMHLVRYYAANPVLPTFVRWMTLHDSPAPAAVSAPVSTSAVAAAPAPPVRSTVDRRATIHGSALWWSGVDATRRWQRHIWKTEFYVDGKLLYTDNTWPYSFHRTEGWDTRTVANGWHMLSVLSYGTHHYRAWKRIPVHVVNPPMRVRVTGAISGGAVDGDLTLSARVNQPAERVVLYADGKPVSRDDAAPYTLRWDTTTASEGAHELIVYARGDHGHRTALTMPVVVANDSSFPEALSRNWVTHHLGDEYLAR
jgi:N-acetylmuramoyl-L-alanine amidase/Bacterial Ig domain